MTPEDGVTGYAWDKTQGPCCAIACGASTIYRNYFGLDGTPQTSTTQIENLRDVLMHLGPLDGRFDVRGGYTMADDAALRALTEKVASLDEAGRDAVKRSCASASTDCQVTSQNWGRDQLRDTDHVVTQIFASACSVAYSGNGSGLWKAFASLVLEAYEAALIASALNALDHPDRPHASKGFLTAVGGGVFGNASRGSRAPPKGSGFGGLPADVRLVTYAPPVPRPFETLAAVAESLAESRKRPRDEGAPAARRRRPPCAPRASRLEAAPPPAPRRRPRRPTRRRRAASRASAAANDAGSVRGIHGTAASLRPAAPLRVPTLRPRRATRQPRGTWPSPDRRSGRGELLDERRQSMIG